MRGNYYTDADRANGAPQGPYTGSDAWRLPKDDNRPQVIVSPETPASPADIRAIVQFVALQVLQGELDWSESDLRESHSALAGITRAQLDAAIREGLA